MIDKFIKFIKKPDTLVYLFYGLSAIAILNRFIELSNLIRSGSIGHYWNSYFYTAAIVVTVLGYFYYCSSSFAKDTNNKIKYFVITYGALFAICFCMLAQWGNEFAWYLLNTQEKLPYVMENFGNSVIAAVRSVSLYLPLLILTPSIPLLHNAFNDKQSQFEKCISELSVIDTSKAIEPTGPLTCEVTLCLDDDSGNPIVTYENRRMEATLIQGATGTGKTATLMLPMCSQDIEKKYFFREMGKELGYTALQKGLCYIDKPVVNQELTKNFTLDVLKPFPGKEKQFKAELAEMIKYEDVANNKLYYRDLGLTVVEPDGEYIKNFRKIVDNYGIDVLVVDPLDESTVGINPFINHDPAKVASIISTVLKGMYESENPDSSNQFFGQVTQQALENLAILLKVMYPRLHGGLMPTLEDMLHMLYDYNIVEDMCQEVKKDPILEREYTILINYFEKNFYKPTLNERGFPIPGTIGSGRRETEQFLYGATTQLDNLMRHSDVKRILCSRTNNIDFDDVLATGKVVTCCTRRGQLGSLLAKPFGMFFILSMQDAVLRRPGNEKTRIPHFLYIDEFPDFVNKETETCFTLFRKYRCGMIIAIQNLSQLERVKSMKFYKQVVVSNTKTQLIFGDTNVEDSAYWQEAFGMYEYWDKSNSLSVTPMGNASSAGINPETTSMNIGFSYNVKSWELSGLEFKHLIYRTKDDKGKQTLGRGKTNFINKKHWDKHDPAEYNFEKFIMYFPNQSQDNANHAVNTESLYSNQVPNYEEQQSNNIIDATVVDEFIPPSKVEHTFEISETLQRQNSDLSQDIIIDDVIVENQIEDRKKS